MLYQESHISFFFFIKYENEKSCVCVYCVCVFTVCVFIVCVCVILLLRMMDVFSCSHEEDQKNSSDVHVFYTLLTMEVCL